MITPTRFIPLAEMEQHLNLNVIAEGVETEGQLRLLESLNCSEMQGYFFSRLLPADELGKFLDNLEGIYRKELT